MKYTYFILLSIVLFIVACNSSKMVAKTVAPAPVIAEKTIAPVVAADANITRGKKLYVTVCTGCHAYKTPANYTAGQWNTILETMFVKASIYDSKEREMIRSFVASEARQQK
jgi:cytochrome c5